MIIAKCFVPFNERVSVLGYWEYIIHMHIEIVLYSKTYLSVNTNTFYFSCLRISDINPYIKSNIVLICQGKCYHRFIEAVNNSRRTCYVALKYSLNLINVDGVIKRMRLSCHSSNKELCLFYMQVFSKFQFQLYVDTGRHES